MKQIAGRCGSVVPDDGTPSGFTRCAYASGHQGPHEHINQERHRTWEDPSYPAFGPWERLRAERDAARAEVAVRGDLINGLSDELERLRAAAGPVEETT